MRKAIDTENEKLYKSFDKKRQRVIRGLSVTLLVLLTCFVVFLLVITSTIIPLVITVVLIVLYIISARFICKDFYRKHQLLYTNAYGEQKEYVRTGIFKELWDEYDDNRFEALVEKGNIIFEETYNNCIEIIIKKNKHEFIITIDEEEIAFIVDEETDDPIEEAVPLSEIADINAFLVTVSSIIAKYS